MPLARTIYEDEDYLSQSFFRDMVERNESARIAKLILPSQCVRGMLISAVLYPILLVLGELSFGLLPQAVEFSEIFGSSGCYELCFECSR